MCLILTVVSFPDLTKSYKMVGPLVVSYISL